MRFAKMKPEKFVPKIQPSTKVKLDRRKLHPSCIVSSEDADTFITRLSISPEDASSDEEEVLLVAPNNGEKCGWANISALTII